MAKGASIYQTVGVPSQYEYFGAALFSGFLLILLGFFVRRKLRSGELLPEGRFSIFNAAVEVIAIFRNFLHGMIGHGSDKFVPIIVITFLLILVNNLSGLIPGFLSPSENLSNNLGMALIIFISYQYFGIKEHGFAYVKQFTGGLPMPGYGLVMSVILSMIALLLVVIELVGHVVRPMSLSLRLFGTISGDHKLLVIVSDLTYLFIPVLVMMLGLLVSVVQAFVFSLLSTVYIKLAVSHDH
jgi:F-type H+-transporting ATPase subunit a